MELERNIEIALDAMETSGLVQYFMESRNEASERIFSFLYFEINNTDNNYPNYYVL
jgi:hypothetical protein